MILLIVFTFRCQNNNEHNKAIEYLENVAILTNFQCQKNCHMTENHEYICGTID